MMSDTPYSNAEMLNSKTTTYEKSLFSGDKGLWTVFEIVKRPVAKVASEGQANSLIAKLKKADALDGKVE